MIERVVLKIGERTLHLTYEELLELKQDIDKILNEPIDYTPYIPYMPYITYPENIPWTTTTDDYIQILNK